MDHIKFIHCADLHIDSPFKGISDVNPELKELLYQSTFNSFNSIVELAIQEQVHCVIISGDIYDGADKSLLAQLKFRNGLQRLSDEGIPSYIVYGNHDPLDSWSATLEWPENVFQFGGEEVSHHPLVFNGEVIAHIYGISFSTKVVTDNLAIKFERMDDNIPAIAVLHTNVGENTGHKPYAPATKDELILRNMDYWALGHLHKFQILSDCNPAIVYPGNSQARNPRERGSKGCCLITLHRNGDCEIEHVSTDVVRYESKLLDIADVDTLDDVINRVKSKCEDIASNMDGRNAIIRISLSGRCSVNSELQKGDNIKELVEQIRERFEDQTPWIWLEKINLNTSGIYDIEELKKGNDFFADIITYYGELDQNEENYISNIRELLDPMFSVWQGQKYLEEISDDEIIKLAKKARNWTLDEMLGDN